MQTQSSFHPLGIVIGLAMALSLSGSATAWNADDNSVLNPTRLEGFNASGNLPADKAYQHLEEVMDKYHRSFDIYTDISSGGNHFVHRAKMGMETDITVDESSNEIVHSGATAIKNTFSPSRSDSWAGLYFQNGVLLSDKPESNWGTYPDAGFDLRGANKLTFWARGEQGGERIEFFAFGTGRDYPTNPYPDSEEKVTLCGRLATPCYITLDNIWQEYTINLSGLNLSYIIGGFGWVTNAPQNNNKNVTFYLDDISYDKTDPGGLRFLVSYEVIPSDSDFDTQQRNVAYAYDNALTLIAFTNAQNWDRAKLLADSFVYAQEHDRYYTDGRLRNAYQAGDLSSPPGWVVNGHTGTARMPGWWNEQGQVWNEEEGLAGTSTGNLAWVMLALLNYYAKQPEEKYLNATIDMGDWIDNNTRSDTDYGGYTGGYTGWEPNPIRSLWKSTEHNLDLYVAFERLYRITGNTTMHDRALHAGGFVDSMWNSDAGHFWTGTLDNGSINKQVIPLDAQTWSLLALNESNRTRLAIAFAEKNHNSSYQGYSGFDFNTDRDMPWFEGTAQMVVSYWILENDSQAQLYTQELENVQSTSTNGNGRGIVAAPADNLTTGFEWLYFNRLHVGATAWFIFAENKYNPYWDVTGKDIYDYYRGLTGSKDVADTPDLLKAADDWSNNVIPPGFTRSITTQQLLALANEWSSR